MGLANDIYSTLSASSGVLAAFGLSAAPVPIYPGRPPAAAAFPYVVWLKVISTSEAVHTGTSGIANVRLQFSTFAESYTQADAIRSAIKTALDGNSFSSTEPATIEDERDLYDPQLDVHHLILEVHTVELS